jgi:hypothetical protein
MQARIMNREARVRVAKRLDCARGGRDPQFNRLGRAAFPGGEVPQTPAAG